MARLLLTEQRTPSEVMLSSWKIRSCLSLCVGLSLLISMKVVVGVTSLGAALTALSALFAGCFTADFAGAVFHWNMDNYPKGHNGFIAHHRDPKAIARRSLQQNVAGTVVPLTPLFVATSLLPGGPLTAFLLGTLGGILLTEHAHGYSHTPDADLPWVIRVLQSIPVLPILLPPAQHQRHHERPLGKNAYGGLNGWSNGITEITGFFRLLEKARETLTGEKPIWEKEGDPEASVDRPGSCSA